jgi:hypothetical protein
VALSIFLLIAAGTGFAQDTQEDIDLDALFGDETVVAQEPGEVPKIDPVSSLTKTEGVRIGGLFSGSLSSAFTWNNLWDGSSTIFNPESRAVSLGLGATVFFDARPKDDFRVYGAAKTSWPLSRTVSGVPLPNIQIFELFSDFSINDRVFFRFGKSTVKWGVGYFWSPADVINLESINIFDAETQREGPVNFRVHFPLLGTQSNFYLYTILDSSDIKFETSAMAAKAEFLIGSYELGLGGYYRYDTAERAMLTLTGPFGDMDVFGEAMISRGSAKTFVQSIKTSADWDIEYSTASDVRDNFYFSASIGAIYSNSGENFSALAQYFYNGEGYTDTNRDSLTAAGKAALANAMFFGDVNDLSNIGSALAQVILGSGLHYAAVNISKGEIFWEDLSVSALVLANLSDFSGIVKPSATWKFSDNFSITASPTFVFGPEDGEYSFLSGGPKATLSLGAKLSGAF